MARFEGNNPDYAAGLVLNMREVDEGGPVLSPCSADWRAGQSRRQTELLVLVHGFNNHRREAQDAYLGFRALQKQRLDAAYTSGFEDMLGDGFWPGDANFTGPLDLVDFLVYPATVARAKQTAVVLAGYLAIKLTLAITRRALLRSPRVNNILAEFTVSALHKLLWGVLIMMACRDWAWTPDR